MLTWKRSLSPNCKSPTKSNSQSQSFFYEWSQTESNTAMGSVRELLIDFCSSVEPTSKMIAGVLEHGIENFLSKSNQLLASKPTHNQSPASLTKFNVITYLDKDWPNQLFDLDDEMPLVLWVNCDLIELLALGSSIALTGPQQMSISDARIAGQLISASENAVRPILTDGARGTGELLIRLGITKNVKLAVVKPTGLQINSTRNLNLPDQVIQISEYAPTVIASKNRLVRRNRILAALSSLTIAISPRPYSGAASIWHWADLLGRNRVSI
jgi:predicted Rossmann fold nucleotide-binding protein DprA/Smf involved in DNA uptake